MHSKLRWLAVVFWLLLSVVLAERPVPVITPVPTPTPVPFPSPTPTSTVPSTLSDLRPAATFKFADGTLITTRSTTGQFQLVKLHPNELVDVALQFPAALPSNSLMAQSLDGAKIISLSKTSVSVSGLVSIRFQALNLPGLYRVLVRTVGGPCMLRFWVADVNHPNNTRPVLNPSH